MSVMALLDAHLEQISQCAASIAELSFPPPKQFTNALLQPHHITTLIRDTEAHERALFTVPAPEPTTAAKRRTTVFQNNANPTLPHTNTATLFRAPRRNTAVAAVLGSDLASRIQQSDNGTANYGYRRRSQAQERGEVDIEVLLEGADKLCNAYSIPSAKEKISQYRRRYRELAANIAHYEGRIAEQTELLGQQMTSRSRGGADVFDEEDDQQEAQNHEPMMSAEEMRQEEAEVRELERKKRMLEEKVMGKT